MLLEKIECELTQSVTEQTLDAARRVHKELGPAQDKAAYLERLCRELELREISCARSVWQAEEYAGVTLNCGHEIDLVVDGSLVVELRAQPRVRRADEQHLLTLLTLSRHQAGLVLNFGERKFEQGVRRLYHGGQPTDQEG